MNNIKPNYSKEQVIKNVKKSGIVATILLFLVVLPAEYNIDITGFWSLTGLVKLSEDYRESNKEVESISQDEYEKQKQELLSESSTKTVEKTSPQKAEKTLTRTITIGPRWNREIKYKMNKWDVMRFSWSSPEIVYLDQHWEPTTDAGSAFLPFKSTKTWKFKRDSDTLTAEFTGTHGWYWRNLSNRKIEIELTMKGQFEEK